MEHGATKLAGTRTRATPGAFCSCQRHRELGIHPGRCLRTEVRTRWGRIKSGEKRSSACQGHAPRRFLESLVKVGEL